MADRVSAIVEALRQSRALRACLDDANGLRLRTLLDMTSIELERELQRLTEAGQA